MLSVPLKFCEHIQHGHISGAGIVGTGIIGRGVVVADSFRSLTREEDLDGNDGLG